ncbi:Syntaxin-binding protein 1 [Thelohanellus kitauei]|uniref:Syntaxin-binding protein 1 n=1 Tax=Thelohanellus kitauei TaxID=669202 RepID=A0A0C2MVY6_THEKT|nr:Syntaxin-binding protein 1 [Thelohanellus kitauei]
MSIDILKEIIKPSELTDRGFISTQGIGVSLQPLPIHLIYCILPTQDNFQTIIDNVSPYISKFLTIHIFTFGLIPDSAIELLKSNNQVVSKLLTLLELPLTFTIQTGDLLTLGPNFGISDIYLNQNEVKMNEISSRLRDLFLVMNDRPAIRYYKQSSMATGIANSLEKLLVSAVSARPGLGGSGSDKRRSLCLILDRSFDQLSPFIHDLTLEAMAHDLLEVKGHVCTFKEDGQTFNVKFDDNDQLWQGLRLKHIADVSNEIATKTRDFSEKNHIQMPEGEVTVAGLRRQIAKLPTLLPEFQKLQSFLALASKLMDIYKTNKLKQITQAEQEFATNLSSDGNPIADNFALYYNVFEEAVCNEDKLRLVLLFALKNNTGISYALTDKLLTSSKIESSKQFIEALKLINFNMVEDPSCARPAIQRAEEDSNISTGYAHSRFVPYMWHICKGMTSQTLEEDAYPFVGERVYISATDTTAKKAFEFGKYSARPDANAKKNSPRLYIFVLGGTLSNA